MTTPSIASVAANEVVFRAVDEEHPGPKLRSLFERRAEAYDAWCLQEGDAARPSLVEGVKALGLHMPEFVDLHAELCREVAEVDAIVARMFTFLSTRSGTRATFLDREEARGSNPLSPTMKAPGHGGFPHQDAPRSRLGSERP